MSKKFAYSLDEEMYHGEFDSIEEALRDASYDGWDEECPDVWVAECFNNFTPSVSACWFVEELEQVAEDECGWLAEDWLLGVPKEAMRELQESLDKLTNEWLTKHHFEPHWFEVENPVQYNYFEWKNRLEN